jgi:hypothetical protein
MRTVFFLFTAIFISSAGITPAAVNSPDGDETCDTCGIENGSKSITGILQAISQKAGMLQVRNGKDTIILKYNEDTILLGAESIGELTTPSAWTIEFREGGDIPLAISIEPPQRDPSLSEKEIDAVALSLLLPTPPERSRFTLVDSRSVSAYENSHIKGAISIYYGDFARNLDKLPPDKDQLIVFYCDGSS